MTAHQILLLVLAFLAGASCGMCVLAVFVAGGRDE